MEKKKETIKIEKNFLDLTTKTITELKNQVDLLQKEIIEIKNRKDTIIPSPIPTGLEKEGQGVFWSAEITFRNPKSLQEQEELQTDIILFRKELEVLMSKYRICSLTASIFFKNNEPK